MSIKIRKKEFDSFMADKLAALMGLRNEADWKEAYVVSLLKKHTDTREKTIDLELLGFTEEELKFMNNIDQYTHEYITLKGNL